MKTSYLKSDEFQGAHEQFSYILEELVSDRLSDSEHGEVEKFLHCEGNELLRRLFQGYLDKRSGEEVKQSEVVDASGVVHTHRRAGCRRTLMSEFGEVVLERIGYGGRGLAMLYPLDVELNLAPDKYTHGLRLRAVEEAIKSSFDEGVSAIEKTTGGKVPKSQLRALVGETSQDFHSYYEQKAGIRAKASDILVLSSDGKGIVMRQEDLREATKKAAERQQRKPVLRLKAGEKRQRKRMAQVAAIYDMEPYRRTAAEIVQFPNAAETKMEPRAKRPRPRPQNKRVWASVEESTETVIEQLFAEALDRDPKQTRSWVMLVDGHEEQLRTIDRWQQDSGKELTIILDVVHVLEYLWKAAFCFYDSQQEHEQAQQWVGEKLFALLETGNASEVAAGMRRSATRRGLSQSQREAVDDCADYLHKYKAYLRYDVYLAHGYPIGSGVIEGACRHLINDRLAITGARWRLTTSEALLKLRSLKSSGDLEAYFKFHQAQELQRNHRSKFESGEKMAA